jgi:tRNA A-37 threonylcarbamoyl transferase component Bud32
MTSNALPFASALAGRYAIDRELGQGGMATVYLAQDLRHDRKVAIKVLRPELAAVIGADRFLSEIRTTANLNHPHILPLHDSGQAESFLYYVMPFVEGESLRDRLRREKQLPIGDAVRVATEVADALGYAHRRGIIHRDIKPENILLHDGRALVADFGIALAARSAGARMTETGMSLGTPQYLSPEQAMGERELTARSDVYALGAVTYEMLTGDPPFTASTAQGVVAKVMTEKPVPPSAMRDTVSQGLEHAVLTALAKLPADRFGSTEEFSAALVSERAPPTRASTTRAYSASRLPLLSLGLVALVLAGTTIWALRQLAQEKAARPDLPVYETAILFPDSTPLAYIGSGPLGVGTRAFAVSPDGSTLVFAGQSRDTTRLYLRPLDGSAIAALPGTEGAYAPFFSPDGASIGFFSGGKVKRTSVRGGATVSLADVVLPYGGLWLTDGRILVSADEGRDLMAVPSSGGAPVRIGPTQTRARLVFPEPLPDESHVLMSTVDGHLAVVSLGTGRAGLLGTSGPIDFDSVTAESGLLSGTHPKYVASGHILYHSLDGAVMAVPFDPSSIRVTGPPTPVLSHVRLESIWGAGQLQVTRDGTAIYARGENGRLTSLVWRDDRGRVDTLTAFGRADFGDLDLSADGSRLLVRICPTQGACGSQTLDLRAGILSPLTTQPDGWWDNGDRVFQARVLDSAATGSARRVTTYVYSPDSPATSDSFPGIEVLDVARDGSVLYAVRDTLFVAGSTTELAARRPRVGFRLPEENSWGFQLRPGGEWIAYSAASQQAGEYLVYMARTRPPFERWRASPRGGEEPVWSPAGDLVYREGNRWMNVSPPARVGARPGLAKFLFSGAYLNVLGRSHDIAPDGRHLLIAGPEATTTTSLVVVTSWLSRLPGRAPRR